MPDFGIIADMNTITTGYFRQYRSKLGFTNQANIKNFFGAKDIAPTIDFDYLKLLNKRLFDIVSRLNNVVAKNIKIYDINEFKKEFIDNPYKIIKSNDVLPILNNQGRRPEDVYYNWMRGFVISNFLLNALSNIFSVNTTKITLIGDDDLKNINTFKRTPKADLEIKINKNEKIRIEMQSGFSGTNDIKQHKVLEAKRVFQNYGNHTLAIHFDLYNGQVAFLKLDEIEDNSVNWITRQQMEGQTVFNIEQNHFTWKITENPPKYSDMDFS